MLNELNALESKVSQVVALCRSLRSENERLREQLAVAEQDRNSLAERMAAATARLERLAGQLPEGKS
jgi:cell division protein ZapB